MVCPFYLGTHISWYLPGLQHTTPVALFKDIQDADLLFWQVQETLAQMRNMVPITQVIRKKIIAQQPTLLSDSRAENHLHKWHCLHSQEAVTRDKQC